MKSIIHKDISFSNDVIVYIQIIINPASYIVPDSKVEIEKKNL